MHEVTVRLGDLVVARSSLDRIMQQTFAAQHLALIYPIAQLRTAVVTQCDERSAYDSARRALLKVHGTETSTNSGTWEFSIEGQKGFNKALADLHAEELTFSVPRISAGEIQQLKVAPPLTFEEWLALECVLADEPAAEAPAGENDRHGDVAAAEPGATTRPEL